jgi:predicted translin family RNA/ssDNA-binding protein
MHLILQANRDLLQTIRREQGHIRGFKAAVFALDRKQLDKFNETLQKLDDLAADLEKVIPELEAEVVKLQAGKAS